MKKSFLALIVLALGFSLADNSCKSDNKSEIIGLNNNIHHDDFEYSVTAFTPISQIINEKDTIFAKDIFYLVHFKVVNNALRVGHKWDNSIAYLVDENGNRYENIEEKQKILNKTLSFCLNKVYNTPHGSADSTILVFELPENVKEPWEIFLMEEGLER